MFAPPPAPHPAAPRRRGIRSLRRNQLIPVVGLSVAALALPLPAVAAADDEPFSIAAHLADLPAELLVDGSAVITIANVDAAVAAAGVRAQIAHHPDQLDVESLLTWLGPITGMPLDRDATPPTYAPVFVPFPVALPIQYAVLTEETAALTGWSIAGVSSFAAVDVLPGAFAVAHGEFDDSTLDAGLTDVGGGIVSLGDADDFTTNFAADRNALDQLGRPVRMAQRDGAIALSTSTPNVASWLAGPTPSAADDPALAAIAAELDAAGALSAVIGPMGLLDPSFIMRGDADAAEAAELLDTLTAQALPGAVTDVGIGWGVDDDGDAAITLVYFTLGDADEAAARLEGLFADGVSPATGQPLAELLTLDAIHTGDGTVTATLRPADGRPPMIPYNMYMQRELLFIAAG